LLKSQLCACQTFSLVILSITVKHSSLVILSITVCSLLEFLAMSVRALVVCLFTFTTSQTVAQKLRGSNPSALSGNTTKLSEPTPGCKGKFCDGIPDDRFAVLLEKGRVSVDFGNNEGKGEKCVTSKVAVECDKDAGNLGKRLNDDDHADSFEISMKENGRQVCARRIDKDEGWGMFLKIECHEAKQSSEKCMCLTTAEEDCRCKGCSEAEQMQTCEELLGPCACVRSEQGLCDCNGYCHTRDTRKDACEREPGCLWSGMWCEAQVGLLWD